MRKRNLIITAMALSFAPPAFAGVGFFGDHPIRFGDTTQDISSQVHPCEIQRALDETADADAGQDYQKAVVTSSKSPVGQGSVGTIN